MTYLTTQPTAEEIKAGDIVGGALYRYRLQQLIDAEENIKYFRSEILRLETENHPHRIGKAIEEGCDPEGGMWVIICDTHSLIFNVPTKKSAIFQAQTLCDDQCSAFEGHYGWIQTRGRG
jgi:hypothetical protein